MPGCQRDSGGLASAHETRWRMAARSTTTRSARAITALRSRRTARRERWELCPLTPPSFPVRLRRGIMRSVPVSVPFQRQARQLRHLLQGLLLVLLLAVADATPREQLSLGGLQDG